MAIGTGQMSETAASVAAPAIAGDPPPALELYRLSIEQYHQMIDSSIFSEDEHVELLEGCLVRQTTKKPAHVVATGLVQDALTPLVPAGWHVSVQDPVTTDDSEPEPDIKVVRGERRDYAMRHPGPGDVALVVEVAESSLAGDRGIKKRIYARA